MATFVSRNDDGGSWHPLSRYSLPPAPHSDRKSRQNKQRPERHGDAHGAGVLLALVALAVDAAFPRAGRGRSP